MKKLALVLALCLLLSSCSVSEIEELEKDSENEVSAFRVDTSYFGVGFAKSESADPYTSPNKLNSELMGLICEPLFSVTPTFSALPVLCSEYVTQDKTYIFTIRSDATFSDGSSVLPSDVEYSLRAACEADSYYANSLSIVESISSSDKSGTVTVRLRYDNSRFPLLLDIPIIKKGTRGNTLPTGSGLYAPNDDLSALVMRRNHHSKSEGLYSSVALVNVSSTDEMLFEFDNHTISLLSNDPTGTAPLSLMSAAEIYHVPTTRLHYIGFNFRREIFKDKEVRLAIARAIDRESAAKSDFALMGTPSTLPFSPHATAYSEEFAASLSYDGATPIALNEPITLLVNSENNAKLSVAKRIAETLTRLGLPCTVRAESFSDYAAALAGGNFDIYYGEVSLGADFDLTRILQGSLNYGAFYDTSLLALHSAYLSGDEGKDDFLRAFCDVLPFVPIMFKSTAVHTPKNFFETLTPTATNVYYNFAGWTLR